MPLVSRGNHCSAPLPPPSSSKPKPSKATGDPVRPPWAIDEERGEGRGAGEEWAAGGRASGRARKRLHGFRRAGRPADLPARATAASLPPFASTAIGALSRRLLAHFPAIDDGSAALLPPSLPSSARLPRLSKFCRSFNSSFVVRQPRERLQQCDAPPSSLLAATKVRSRSDLLLATIKTLDT